MWFGGEDRGSFTSVARSVNGTYEPFVGDFDGDGRSDVFWYGPGSSYDVMWFGTSTRGKFVSVAKTVNGAYLVVD
jgi:hypothetical protein